MLSGDCGDSKRLMSTLPRFSPPVFSFPPSLPDFLPSPESVFSNRPQNEPVLCYLGIALENSDSHAGFV